MWILQISKTNYFIIITFNPMTKKESLVTFGCVFHQSFSILYTHMWTVHLLSPLKVNVCALVGLHQFLPLCTGAPPPPPPCSVANSYQFTTEQIYLCCL